MKRIPTSPDMFKMETHKYERTMSRQYKERVTPLQEALTENFPIRRNPRGTI